MYVCMYVKSLREGFDFLLLYLVPPSHPNPNPKPPTLCTHAFRTIPFIVPRPSAPPASKYPGTPLDHFPF